MNDDGLHVAVRMPMRFPTPMPASMALVSMSVPMVVVMTVLICVLDQTTRDQSQPYTCVIQILRQHSNVNRVLKCPS